MDLNYVSGDKLVRRFTESNLGNLYFQGCNHA